jgi:glycerol kinase
MKKTYVLAIDQGTTGSRAFIFNQECQIVASAYQEFKQYFPKPGWVEHDANEIWNSCVNVIKAAIHKAKISAKDIKAIGITNQRETTVLWDRKSGKPIHRAIVWQCRRTTDVCQALKKKGLENKIRQKTGLVLDPYFSGTKIKWILDHVPGARKRAQKGQLAFGTIDSWLIWKLTGGKAHTTDFTNASRTLIFNIRTKQWDKALLTIFNIPSIILPKAQASGSVFGKTSGKLSGLPDGIPITGVLGDQQAALYGQGCFTSGTSKNTYGTGCFLVLNTGKKYIHSSKGLLTTLASDALGQPVYALEGSVFIAGAVVQWIRDQLGVIKNSSEIETAIKGTEDTAGVYFVPAFAGLGAPYWDAEVRGIMTGLTRGSNLKHILRAALESICYQTKDVFDLMQKESKTRIKELKVDGGACRNNFLMQFQSDILNAKIIRPKIIESTAFGVAQLAGIAAGLWNKRELSKLSQVDAIFSPKMNDKYRRELYEGWQKAIKKARVS